VSAQYIKKQVQLAMNLLKTCCFLPALLALVIDISGQIKEIGLPEIRNYKPTDYKGGTQNWGIDQDKNDNIYFANNAGLFQFDGFTWNKFSLPNHPSVRAVKAGNDDKIYVGGYNEFGYFKAGEKGKLVYHSLIHLLNENYRRQIDFIWKIHSYNNTIIFQSFERVYIYDGKKLLLLEAPGRFQFSFLVNNKLYFQDVEMGLLEFKDSKLIPLQGTQLLNKTEVWGMFSLRADTLLIATQNKGLFIYTNSGLKPWNTEANYFLQKNGCLGGAIIKEKFIAFNSVLDGTIVSNIDGRIVQHINQKKGLHNNTILTSFVDNKNNLWLGLDNGIDFINESSPLTYLGSSYNISTVYASVIYKENIYVATNRGLFYRSQANTYNDDAFSLIEGTTGQAWNIQVVDDQLICAHNTGLLLISEARVTQTIDAKGYWGIKKIPGQTGLCVASHYNGFSIFENKGSGWQLKNNIAGLTKSAAVFETDGSAVWMTKDDVLYRAKFNTDYTGFKSVKTYETITDSSKGAISLHLLNGKIYFQFNNRFHLFSHNSNLFEEDKTISALFNSIPPIRFLQQDANKNIWYIYNESLGMLKKMEDGTYKNIAAPFYGLGGNLMTDYPSINTNSSPNIFIGLTNGLAHFNLELINYAPSKPKVYIRSFSSQADTFILGNVGNQPLQKYHIPFRLNNIKFTFSSPVYETPGGIEFSYKLEGFDTTWSNWASINFKEYTNLHEGNYKMYVKAKNSFGALSANDILSFSIAPPFYRHKLAYLIYIVAAGFMFFLLHRRVKLKIRKNKYYETIEQRKLYLEKEAKIKLEQDELEKEIERLKMEKLKMSLLTKDKELLNNSFQVVRKNKILNGIIQKIKNVKEAALDEATKLELNKLNKSISKELDSDKSWKELEKHIKNVHFDFLKRLKEKFPAISSRELDLSTYLLLNMSSKEIAEIMNISFAGVELARYRLRKKMGLQRSENLVGFLMSI
jgi:DNA-binding CsgD family transcriptional regulator